MRSLLELATAEEPVVFLPYSRATVELTSALRAYKSSLQERMSKEAAERHLRDAVVVVSIGNCSDDWVDGPAYIHVATFEDLLTNTLGTTSKKPAGAGVDAVFLNCHAWSNSESEAHNFASCSSQYLSVIMLANNTTSFRKLYDLARSSRTAGQSNEGSSKDASDNGLGHESDDDWNLRGRFASMLGSFVGKITNRHEGSVGGGNLIIPENVDDLTKAMIRITHGLDYVWSDSAKDGAQEIPSEQDSIQLLKEHLDPDKVDKILKRF